MCICQQKRPTKEKEIEDPNERENDLNTQVLEKAKGDFYIFLYAYKVLNTPPGLLASYCCYNMLAQTWWLKTTQTWCLLTLEVRNLKSLSLG